MHADRRRFDRVNIRRRAYEIYESRGGGPGSALDDWLQAERELIETSSGYTDEARIPPPLLDEWPLIHAAGLNLLLIGVEGVTGEIVEALRPELREPITIWQPGERLVLPPAAHVGTLILYDVSALPLADQRRLFVWLQDAVGMQVISTASAPLLPLIGTGAFLDTLYYRLNTACLEVGASPEAACT
jgi:hypothetical protein